MRWLRRLMPPGALASFVVLIAATQPFGAGCSSVAQAAPTMPAAAGLMSAAQLVGNFEHNNWSPNAAAGIVGNMAQEDPGFNPATAGGGLVQNLGVKLAQQQAYDSQHHLDPNSYAGQLEFLVWFVPQQSWWKQFDGAPTPQDAALWFQNGYEQCSGAGQSGTDQVGGGLCNPANRQAQAAAALAAAGGGSGTFVGASPGVCASVVGGATDPAPGGTWSRLDMGFDGNYSMAKGAVAIFSGVVHCCISGWPGNGTKTAGPYFWIVNDDQSGPDYTRAVYYAEGAALTVANGAHVTVGQPVGSPLAKGGDGSPGNFEIGPAQVSGGDTLAKSYLLGSPAARQEVFAFYTWMRSLGAGPATSTSFAGSR